MNVLVCGADGFLGRHVAEALRRRGHAVIRSVRQPRSPGDVAMDYRRDLDPSAWHPRLAGVDAVVNAVGILNERRKGDFEHIHHRVPAALFRACASAGIRRVVQISALGDVGTPYLTSKRAADAELLELLPDAVVLRPGLVYGRDGASTRFFLALASLPVRARLLGAGQVQPVHVDDVAEVVVRALEDEMLPGGIVELPGPRRIGFEDWLSLYRSGMGLPPALRLPLPAMATAMLSRVVGRFPGAMLNPASWAMLQAGNVGDPSRARALLGRELVRPEHFIKGEERENLRLRALAGWQRPLARGALAAIWLGAALVSAGLHPIGDSLARLGPFGLEGLPALVVLAAAILLDLTFGLLTWLKPGRRLWQAQLAVVVVYTLLVIWRLPGYLVDPFGPILKNLAVMALIVQLWSEETSS